MEIDGLQPLNEMLADGRPVLVAFWHGKYVPLFSLLRGRPAGVFTSCSFRGEVEGEICRRFGYRCVQVPDQGWEHPLNVMRRALAAESAWGLAVDGPRGPYHRVKRGVFKLASELGYAIVPASVVSRQKRVLAHRWDRMELPRFFADVYLMLGEPLEVPSGLAPDELRVWASRLRERLEDLEQQGELRARRTLQTDPCSPRASHEQGS